MKIKVTANVTANHCARVGSDKHCRYFLYKDENEGKCCLFGRRVFNASNSTGIIKPCAACRLARAQATTKEGAS